MNKLITLLIALTLMSFSTPTSFNKMNLDGVVTLGKVRGTIDFSNDVLTVDFNKRHLIDQTLVLTHLKGNLYKDTQGKLVTLADDYIILHDHRVTRSVLHPNGMVVKLYNK